jgi:hypothetical protein
VPSEWTSPRRAPKQTSPITSQKWVCQISAQNEIAMESRSSSPSPGQSGQDDRDDDADSASGQVLPPRQDE